MNHDLPDNITVETDLSNHNVYAVMSVHAASRNKYLALREKILYFSDYKTGFPSL